MRNNNHTKVFIKPQPKIVRVHLFILLYTETIQKHDFIFFLRELVEQQVRVLIIVTLDELRAMAVGRGNKKQIVLAFM